MQLTAHCGGAWKREFVRAKPWSFVRKMLLSQAQVEKEMEPWLGGLSHARRTLPSGRTRIRPATSSALRRARIRPETSSPMRATPCGRASASAVVLVCVALPLALHLATGRGTDPSPSPTVPVTTPPSFPAWLDPPFPVYPSPGEPPSPLFAPSQARFPPSPPPLSPILVANFSLRVQNLTDLAEVLEEIDEEESEEGAASAEKGVSAELVLPLGVSCEDALPDVQPESVELSCLSDGAASSVRRRASVGRSILLIRTLQCLEAEDCAGSFQAAVEEISSQVGRDVAVRNVVVEVRNPIAQSSVDRIVAKVSGKATHLLPPATPPPPPPAPSAPPLSPARNETLRQCLCDAQ